MGLFAKVRKLARDREAFVLDSPTLRKVLLARAELGAPSSVPALLLDSDGRFEQLERALDALSDPKTPRMTLAIRRRDRARLAHYLTRRARTRPERLTLCGDGKGTLHLPERGLLEVDAFLQRRKTVRIRLNGEKKNELRLRFYQELPEVVLFEEAPPPAPVEAAGAPPKKVADAGARAEGTTAHATRASVPEPNAAALKPAAAAAEVTVAVEEAAGAPEAAVAVEDAAAPKPQPAAQVSPLPPPPPWPWPHRTILHIGAHKTATTYLQEKLGMNVALLARRGIHYSPLGTVRRHFTATVKDATVPVDDVAWRLIENARARDTIISDENIAGGPGDVVREGVHYPHVKARVARVLELIGRQDVEIFMALRDYAGFSVSMYCEYIRHHEFMPFPEYFELYTKSGFSWKKVIDDVVEAAPAAKITLWDFSRFRDTEHAIFSAMLGFDPAELASPEGPVRASFSAAAMVALSALHGVVEPAQLRKLVRPISRVIPKAEGYPGFNPLAPEVIAEMTATYTADLEAIATAHPNIRML